MPKKTDNTGRTCRYEGVEVATLADLTDWVATDLALEWTQVLMQKVLKRDPYSGNPVEGAFAFLVILKDSAAAIEGRGYGEDWDTAAAAAWLDYTQHRRAASGQRVPERPDLATR